MKNLFLGLVMVFMASVGFAGEKVSDNSQIVVEILVEGQDIENGVSKIIKEIPINYFQDTADSYTVTITFFYEGACLSVSYTSDSATNAINGAFSELIRFLEEVE